MATSSASLNRSPRKNYVESNGGLPPYIRKLARAIHEKRGLPLGQAIRIAIGVVRNYAEGKGNVTAKTRALAVKAVAQYEALLARTKAKRLAKKAKSKKK